MKHISKAELECLYWDMGMSTTDIATDVGVSYETISRWMREYGIGMRTRSESHLGNLVKPSKQILEDMYLCKKMSVLNIANNIGVSRSTLFGWIEEYGIETRTISEALIGKFSGENHPNWKGGIAQEPYCSKFNNAFREAVRIRDDYICQLCGYEQKLNGRELDVHHIHYDKSDCWPDVVALCRSCNTKVNFNRDCWEEYFELMLLERGLFCWSISNNVVQL